jgi:outer membrane protein OmpA-like peptidoglycan-associated protein
MNTFCVKLAVLTAGLGLVPLLVPSGHVEELFLIQEVPDPNALADMMFPASSAKAEKPQYKLRGIHFTDSDAANTDTAPAGEPPPTMEPATAEAPAPPTEGMSIGFRIQFAYNSPELLPDTLPYLDAVGEMMNLERTRDTRLLISGHADASGDEQYNMALSEARALAVANYLEQKYTVDDSRIETIGYGERKPLPNTDPFDPSNRRVEFHPEPQGL